MNLEELKQAADIANEVSPETFIFIYCYKDKAVNKYAPIFTTEKEPKYMVDGLKNAVLKGQQIKELTGLQLCFNGTFELGKGLFNLSDEPQVIADCDVLIEKFGGLADGKVA